MDSKWGNSTHKIHCAYKKIDIYVHVRFKNKEVCGFYIDTGKSGACERVLLEVIARQANRAFDEGTSKQKILNDLKGHHCSSIKSTKGICLDDIVEILRIAKTEDDDEKK